MKGLLFTYLMTYGGAAVSLLNPFYGLLIYVCFAIIKPEAMWPWAVPPGNYSRIVALAMLAGWLMKGCGNWNLGRSRKIVLALLIFMGWIVIGAALAPHQKQAWAFVETFAKIVLPLLVGVTTIDSVSKLKQLAWAIVLSQGYVAFELNMYYFQGNNILRTSGFAAMDNNSAAIAMVTALGVAFFLGLHVQKWWQKGLALAMALFLGHAILFSFSRGGMLAMLISAFAAFLLIPKQPKHYLGFGLALLLGFQLAGPEVRDRFMTAFVEEGGQREASAQSRLDLWADCWDVIKKNPVFGAGPNHWPLLAHHYGWPPGKEAHSLWVQSAAEVGVFGSLLLITFFGTTIVMLWPWTRRQSLYDDPWFADSARMVIASLVGFCIAAQFVSLEALEIPYYVALIGIAGIKLASSSSGWAGDMPEIYEFGEYRDDLEWEYPEPAPQSAS